MELPETVNKISSINNSNDNPKNMLLSLLESPANMPHNSSSMPSLCKTVQAQQVQNIAKGMSLMNLKRNNIPILDPIDAPRKTVKTFIITEIVDKYTQENLDQDCQLIGLEDLTNGFDGYFKRNCDMIATLNAEEVSDISIINVQIKEELENKLSENERIEAELLKNKKSATNKMEQTRISLLKQFNKTFEEIGLPNKRIFIEEDLVFLKNNNLISFKKKIIQKKKPESDKLELYEVLDKETNIGVLESDTPLKAFQEGSFFDSQKNGKFGSNPPSRVQIKSLIAKMEHCQSENLSRKGDGFSVEPHEVIFNEYEPGGIYRKKIFVRNTSKYSTRFRLVLPSSGFSKYFFVEPDGVPGLTYGK